MKKGNDIVSVIAGLRGRSNAFIMARLAEEGITELVPSHGSILVVLYEYGPQSMSEICQKVGRDKSTLTVLVRKLEALGYVTREPDEKDNRITIVGLTEKGRAFRSLFEKISDELLHKIWGDASGDKRETISRELKKMMRRLEA